MVYLDCERRSVIVSLRHNSLNIVTLDDGKARRNAEVGPAVGSGLVLVLFGFRHLLADEGHVPYSNHFSNARADFGINKQLIPHNHVELSSADRCCSQQYPCGHLRVGMRRSARHRARHIDRRLATGYLCPRSPAMPSMPYPAGCTASVHGVWCGCMRACAFAQCARV